MNRRPDQQVQHVLNRLAFGPRPGDAATVRSMGVDVWVARQLDPERISDGPTDGFVAQFPTLGKSGEDLLKDFPPAGQLANELAAKQQQALNASIASASAASGAPAFKQPPIVLKDYVFSPEDSAKIKEVQPGIQSRNRRSRDGEGLLVRCPASGSR